MSMDSNPHLLLQISLLVFLGFIGNSICLNPNPNPNRNPNSSDNYNPRKIRVVSKRSHALDIESIFTFPSPLPTWPPGTGFATGTIDLGGVAVTEITSFNKVWATCDGGPDNAGATFFEPAGLPDGFFMLGSYAQPNNRPLFGRVLVGKDVSDESNPALKQPIDYALVWSSQSLNVKEDVPAYIWAPVPLDGYEAVGLVVTTTPDKPTVDKVRCVRSDLTSRCEPDEWIWGREGDANSNEFNIYDTRPTRRGKLASAVNAGTFMARSGGDSTNDMPLLACLKNVNSRNFTNMPNMAQVKTIIQTYFPRIYNHPDEKYLPSSVNWFFENGALLFKKGDESNPVPIDPTGSNLPKDGTNDDEYWIDLPKDKGARESVMKGNMSSASPYVHIKPMLGGTYTDLAVWLFYPFNGGSRAKVGLFSISLGKVGEHVSDWEHVTLRVSNFNGMLTKVFFAQHSGGQWVHASDLQFYDGNKFVGYASFHGHACYHKPGIVMQGSEYIGIRNDTAKSDKFLDTGNGYTIVSADYLGGAITEPPWLSFARKWGPTIQYDIVDEINRVAKVLPGKLKSAFLKFIKSLPEEVLGEEGPTGPKMKRSWDGDETK